MNVAHGVLKLGHPVNQVADTVARISRQSDGPADGVKHVVADKLHTPVDGASKPVPASDGHPAAHGPADLAADLAEAARNRGGGAAVVEQGHLDVETHVEGSAHVV